MKKTVYSNFFKREKQVRSYMKEIEELEIKRKKIKFKFSINHGGATYLKGVSTSIDDGIEMNVEIKDCFSVLGEIESLIQTKQLDELFQHGKPLIIEFDCEEILYYQMDYKNRLTMVSLKMGLCFYDSKEKFVTFDGLFIT